MAEFIEVLSPTALADLDKLNAKLIETVASVDKINAKFKSVATPSGVDGATKDMSQKYKELEATVVKLQSQLQKSADQNVRNAERTRLAEIKLAQDREKAFDKYEKQLQREQAKLEASANVYNKVQAKMNELSNEYKSLATKKELGLSLTSKEEQKYTSLQNRIKKYDEALKAVDASMGKYTRNVGNYSGAFNPLSNSINQLTREMPAFANSAQTGFMAISNNLPIFFDSMKQAIAQQKELQAQGQPSKNALQLLAGSFFSLGTALSVGVTLLTVYGPKLWDSISGSKKKKEALEQEQKALESKIEAEKNQNDAIGKSIAQEQSRAKILFEIAKNNEVSFAKRKEAIDELKQRYPDYLKSLSDEEILAGKTAEAERKLNEALVGRGYALATQNLLEENATKQMSAQVEYQKVISKGFKDLQKQTTSTGAIKNMDDYAKSLRNVSVANAEAERILQEKLKPLKEEESALMDLFKTNAKYLTVVNESTKATNKSTKAQKDKNKAEQDAVDPSSIQAMEDMISELERQMKTVDITSESYNYLGGVLKLVKLSYNALMDAMKDKEPLTIQSQGVKKLVDAKKMLHESTQQAIKDFEDEAERTKKQKEELARLKKSMEDFTKGFSGDFFSRTGFPTLFKLMNEEIKGFGDNWGVTFQTIGEIAQETFNFISSLSQQRFKNQYDNLQKEKEIAIAFAGESTTAREEIERQFAERQRQIKRREFKAKQQEAIFNIAIDTAQGIVGAIAKSPLTGGMPWTAIIASLGAIQLGVVASQQIPQYWTGTDDAKQGWAWTQEKGREIITDKNGRIKSTGSDKGASLTYLNKGDKVYNAQKSAMMFDNALNGLLMQNGIAQPKVEVNNVLLDSQVDRIVSAVGSIDPVSLNIDKRGLNAYVRNGHSQKEIQNLRITGKGRNV